MRCSSLRQLAQRTRPRGRVRRKRTPPGAKLPLSTCSFLQLPQTREEVHKQCDQEEPVYEHVCARSTSEISIRSRRIPLFRMFSS
jgi:hypothetical protein